jgi:exodeoxyribonuclease VIII
MIITRQTLEERPLSFSSIKEFAKSPRHYLDYISKERTPPTDAMKLGSMVHCMILTPYLFNEQFAVAPDINKRTNAGKEEWIQFANLHAGKTIVNNEDYEHARKLVDGVLCNDLIYDTVMSCTSFEREWRMEVDGLPYRGFFDGESDDYILEVKTITDGHPKAVMSDFIKRKYHMQAGIYNQVSGKKVLYLIVETSSPYLSYLAYADTRYVDLGKKDVSELNNRFHKCLESGDFTGGYDYNNVITIDLPWSVEK